MSGPENRRMGLTAFEILKWLVDAIDLGDERLDRRLEQLARSCLSAEDCTLGGLAGEGKAERKGAQRFMSNDAVEPVSMREGLYEAAWQSARKCPQLVVAFDPTLLDYSFQNQKKDRIPIGDGNGRGYVWLNSTAIDPKSGRFFGPLHQALVSLDGPDDQAVCDYVLGAKNKKMFERLTRNHKQQFVAHAMMVHRRAPPEQEVVYVGDQDFDDGLVFRQLINLPNRHFVIRGTDDRAVQVHPHVWLPKKPKRPTRQGSQLGPTPEGFQDVYLRSVVASLPLRPWQTLQLDARGRVSPAGTAQAELHIGGVPIRLARRSKRGIKADVDEEPIWLNLVVIRQVNKIRGRTPLEWLLLTDLPISTEQEMEHVIGLYRCRMRIEEFFRTTKDVMGIEASELDDARATARMLFFVTLKAMFLDALRADADLPAGPPPTTDQRRSLESGAAEALELEKKHAAGGTVSALTLRRRAEMVLGLLARRGGWASRSGDHLGNLVLLRGLPIFLHDVSEGRYAWLTATRPEDVGS